MMTLRPRWLLLLALALPRPCHAQTLDELMRAVQEDRPDKVASILNARPDLARESDGRGESALYRAAYMNRPRELEQLITSGADVNHTTKRGTTALVAACDRGSVTMVRALLNNGAAVDIPDEHHRTPLHWACYHCFPELVALLLGRGAHAQARDDVGREPLHLAAASGCEDAVRLLLEHGARPDPRDDENLAPLDLSRAGHHGHWEAVEATLIPLTHPAPPKKKRR